MRHYHANVDGIKAASDTQKKNKELQCGATISKNEKNLLIATARSLDVPYYLIIRRLVRYILDGKIEWTDLFRKSNDLVVNEESENSGKIFVRTQLPRDSYAAFTRLAEEWGSTTGVILRRLVLLYIAGKIERHAIWY